MVLGDIARWDETATTGTCQVDDIGSTVALVVEQDHAVKYRLFAAAKLNRVRGLIWNEPLYYRYQETCFRTPDASNSTKG
jgi:hypothetical protein